MTTSAAGSSSNSPRQSAASATSSRSSPPWRAMARSRSNGCTSPYATGRRRDVVAGPHGGERPLEAGEQLGLPGEHLRAPPHLERAPREGVLGPDGALVQRPGGRPIGHQHQVGRAVPVARSGHRRPVGPDPHLVAGVAAPEPRTTCLDHEGGLRARGPRSGPRRRVELRDPRRRTGIRPSRCTDGVVGTAGRLCPRSGVARLPATVNSPAHAIEVAALEKRYGATSGGRRDLVLDRDRRGVRPARTERRGQDDDGRDPRGLPPRRRRRRARARGRSVARRRGTAPADRRDAPGGRAVSRACGRSRRSQLFASYYDDPDDPERLLRPRRPRRLAPHAGAPHVGWAAATAVARARARSGKPTLVFLDEPTAGMDPHARATTWSMIRELRDRGVTVVLTTHAHGRSRAALRPGRIIDHGRLVACDTPQGAHDPRGGGRDHVLDGCRARRSTTLAGAPRRRRRQRARAAPGRLPGRRRRHPASSSPRLTAWLREQRRAPQRAARRAPLAGGRVPPPHRRGPIVRATRDPARRPRVEMLLTLRRAESLLVTLVIPLGILVFFSTVDAVNTTLQGAGRLPRARCARARGDVERDGEPRHRHRVRAALRRAEAPRIDPAVARRACSTAKTAQRARARAGPGDRHRAHRHRARVGRRPAGSSPPSCCCSWAPSRSPASACCSRARSGPRPTWPSPTGCSSCCCSSAAWRTR